MQKLATAAFLTLTPIIMSSSLANPVDAHGNLPEIQTEEKDKLTMPADLQTESLFKEETKTVTEEIPFETIFEEDETKEVGYQEVKEEGTPGTKTLTYKISFWNGEEIGRELVDTTIEEPKPEVVVKGTKLATLTTAELGEIEYKDKMNVWSTSYDGNCIGCTGRTFTGKRVTHGICATDPEIIPLGTKFYVPGYGLCSAEDIGGAVKGKSVDLGFEDVKNGWWSARNVDIYIL